MANYQSPDTSPGSFASGTPKPQEYSASVNWARSQALTFRIVRVEACRSKSRVQALKIGSVEPVVAVKVWPGIEDLGQVHNGVPRHGEREPGLTERASFQARHHQRAGIKDCGQCAKP